MMSPVLHAQIWIAAGHTDLGRGMQGLTALVQTSLEQNPFSGHVFVFRGWRGDLIKIMRFDGDVDLREATAETTVCLAYAGSD